MKRSGHLHDLSPSLASKNASPLCIFPTIRHVDPPYDPPPIKKFAVALLDPGWSNDSV